MITNKKKPIFLAIVSGKGGSGKTTIALSLAVLISRCKLRVLLFDCDFVTNGCTYFFEKHFKDQSNKFCTTEDYIYESNDTLYSDYKECKQAFYPVNSYFGLVPSILRVARGYSPRTGNFSIDRLKQLVEESSTDIVIFDCQAGYSATTKFFLKNSSINLVVMEADAISVSATRVLLSKMPYCFNSKTTYQIMNKVSKEEYDVYASIKAGFIFPNVATIMFEWSIRECFTLNKLPIIGERNLAFSANLCDLACVLFPIYNTMFLAAKEELLLGKRHSLEPAQTRCKMNLKRQKQRENVWIVVILGMIFALIACIILLFDTMTKLSSNLFSIIIFVILIILIIAVTYSRSIFAESRKDDVAYIELKNVLDELDNQISNVKGELEIQSNSETKNS